MGDRRVGEILVHKGAVTAGDVKDGLERQKREPERKIGEILVEEKKTDSKEVISALRDQKKFGKGNVDLQVKVDTKKIDNLVDLTGELVIAQAMLRQNPCILSAGDQKLYNNLNQLNQITSSLQTTAMSMRMVPIKSMFQKMVRLVRDLAKDSGKEVGLKISGEDTEIDRNVVEELYEPMVHMIRNAIDHGIEPPEERQKAGKDEEGTIHLRAHQRGGNIIIEIEDDGCGLDKERIMEKARANNLIADESKITDSQIYNLIFHAGLTTAKKVTDVSGRGVGMDVVKKAIEKLRGRVEINSRPGSGSTFIISLPLTLAIIEGMLVRIGDERYIIPAVAILESFRPDKNQYSTVTGRGEMILSRGILMPLVRLDRMFGVKGDAVHPWDGLVVAVENDGEQRCLLLDELLGKEEVVIKSIGGMKNVKGIAGGAIMGDGRVGLILDMTGIFEIAKHD
jgi:two-component system chemotaxis sensor kinase CheA